MGFLRTTFSWDANGNQTARLQTTVRLKAASQLYFLTELLFRFQNIAVATLVVTGDVWGKETEITWKQYFHIVILGILRVHRKRWYGKSHMTKHELKFDGHLCSLSLPKSGYIFHCSLFPFFMSSGGWVLNTHLAGLEFFGKHCSGVVRKQQPMDRYHGTCCILDFWRQVCEDRGASQSS